MLQRILHQYGYNNIRISNTIQEYCQALLITHLSYLLEINREHWVKHNFLFLNKRTVICIFVS